MASNEDSPPPRALRACGGLGWGLFTAQIEEKPPTPALRADPPRASLRSRGREKGSLLEQILDLFRPALPFRRGHGFRRHIRLHVAVGSRIVRRMHQRDHRPDRPPLSRRRLAVAALGP